MQRTRLGTVSKLSILILRSSLIDTTRDYLDRALSIWGDQQWFKNEPARSSFLRGIHLQSMGSEENMEKGKRWVERAKQLRSEIIPGEEPRELETVDFDDLVIFWSI
jgi:hypothetical protein